MTAAEIARWINPKVRGWMTCYGAFHRSELYPVVPTHQRLPAAVDHERVEEAAGLEESHQAHWTRGWHSAGVSSHTELGEPIVR